MTADIKVGDLVSVEDVKQNVIVARGPLKEVVKVGDEDYYTMDGMYYIQCNNNRYRVSPKDKTDKIEGGYYTPFQRLYGTTFDALGSTINADVFIKLSEENISRVQKEFEDTWLQIFPDSKVSVDIKSNRLNIVVEDKDDVKDVMNLITDKINIFGKKFKIESKEEEGITTITLHTEEESQMRVFDNILKTHDYLNELISCNFRKMPEDDLLYLNNNGRKSFQWEMWSMCNNLCSYCYLGMANRHTDKARQMQSLNDCHKAIDNLDTRIYNNVSIIGGDFWQGQLDEPEVHDSFMSLMEKLAKLYADKKIGALWITCTMTIGDQHHLYEMLEIFDRYKAYPNPKYGSSGLWLCTSWDVQGRFHTPDRKANWEYHIENIYQKYPWIKFNCTIILMEKFLQMYIDGEWSPKEFMKKYHTSLFFKQIGLGEIPQEVTNEVTCKDPNDKIGAYRAGKYYVNKTLGFEFAPHRATMLKFLRKYAIEDPDTYDRLFNIEYRADELHRNYNEEEHDTKTTRNKKSANETDTVVENILNTCGHMINYMPYIDSDKCCMCDKKAIWDSIYGGEI